MGRKQEKKTLKVYTVFLDGIDKTGKDTIRQYIWLKNKALNVFCRGYISLEAYNQKFDRNVEYAEPYKDALYVLLTVNEDDWKIRCKITHEPEIDYDKDSKLFEKVYKSLNEKVYHKRSYNTSIWTPIQIADMIIEVIERLNN